MSKQEIHKFRLTFLRGAAFAAGIAKKVPAVQAAPADFQKFRWFALKKIFCMVKRIFCMPKQFSPAVENEVNKMIGKEGNFERLIQRNRVDFSQNFKITENIYLKTLLIKHLSKFFEFSKFFLKLRKTRS